MVRATREHLARSADEALVIDIDLSILGADPPEYDRFESQIRREYAWVDDALYRAGRGVVLRRFVERERIYQTPRLHARFETAARANLARALAAL
jgi:predicted metal-dependent HD superfamily phosphohydrolase